MTRYARLLTAIVVAALALPPSASLAQQRRLQSQQIIPGGPIIPSGRVLTGGLPNLTITKVGAGVTCVWPPLAQAAMDVSVKNIGNAAAVMPPTMMAPLGRWWVGVWDLNTSPGVMMIAAGKPDQLLPNEVKLFKINVVVRLVASPDGRGFGFGIRVDPANLISESNENDNETSGFFLVPTAFCQ